MRAFIDNNLLIERNRALGFETKAAAAAFGAGPHEILVEYVQYGGGASLEMLWAPAGQTTRPIQPESLCAGLPDARLVARARRAARLAELARWAWMALGAVALSSLLLLAGRAGRRWIASGVPRQSSRVLGFIAVVLGLGTANLAQDPVFVKPFSLDYALTAPFLLLGASQLVDRRDARLAVAAAGLAAVMFSVPSVFLSVALVHLASLAELARAAAAIAVVLNTPGASLAGCYVS